MEWILANWWWVAPVGVPVTLGILKGAAKIIPGVEDDKIVTMLDQWWNRVRQRAPNSWRGLLRRRCSGSGYPPRILQTPLLIFPACV